MLEPRTVPSPNPESRLLHAVLLASLLFAPAALTAQTLVPIGDVQIPAAADGPVFGRPSVAMVPQGDSLAVWQEFHRVDGVDTVEMRGRAYDRDGVPRGESFRIDEPSDTTPTFPVVTARPDGGFLVVWQRSDFFGFADIVGRRVSANGSLDGPEIVLVRENYFDGARETHAVATSATGEIVLAWNSQDPLGDGFMLFRRFTANGGSAGSTGLLGADVGRNPAVDVASDGGFVVVWRDRDVPPGFSTRVLARRFSATDEPLSDAVTLAEGSIRRADVAIQADGSVVVAWVDDDGAPVARRFEGPGLAAGSATVRLAPARDAADVQILRVGQRLFASWSDLAEVDTTARDLFGRFLSADLAPLSDTMRLNPSSLQDQRAGSVASNGSDRLVVAWQHQLPDDFTVNRTVRARFFRIESACGAGSTRLCLHGDRFAVEAEWRSPDGSSGVADARLLTDDSGYFSFFDPNNVELVVKVLDACQLADRYWVFAAGLTDVEVEITVTDTATGQIRRYLNPLSTPFEPVLDTDAFATCP